ncbi:20428_t:CDS:2 [Entrophospora sp. SA101]|nr:7261_t:CDS:2 [Entrophospora sp. SA101]CAJ0761378.1 20428_t:CDS:2 [Entrophospora sp. SA101]
MTDECSLHQTQLAEHKAASHVCVKSDDEISKTVLIEGKEFNPTRKKIEAMINDEKTKINEYCSSHQDNSISHLTKHKKTNSPCSITCPVSKELQKQIKECDKCQSPKLFVQQLKKQIKCEQVVDILVSQSEEERKNSTLLLIKKDNRELEKLEQEKEDKEQNLKEEKQKIEDKILKSTLPLKSKKEVLKEIKLIKGSKISKELERKIASSPVDSTIGEVALQEQVKDLIKSGETYQQLLQEFQEKENEFNKFKEKTERCKDCQKYCSDHQKEIEKHKTCSHCHKNDKQIQQTKEKIKEIKDKLEELKKTKPEAEKEIKKLTKELNKKEEENKKLYHEAFANRVKCPTLNELKEERKKCSGCQSKIEKKHVIKIENPLQQDLKEYLESESKTRSLLKDKKREITDVKFYTNQFSNIK